MELMAIEEGELEEVIGILEEVGFSKIEKLISFSL